MSLSYTPEDIATALSELGEKYADDKANNGKSIGSYDKKLNFIGEKYIRLSMKRSNLKNLIYEQCEFENIAFTNSCFNFVDFNDSLLSGNSFACCNYYGTNFYGDKLGAYTGNGFNQSNFTSSSIVSVTFKSSSFMQTLFNKCILKQTCFRSSTLEGSRFINCQLNTVDFGNANIEFIELIHSDLKNIVFPFYQFAYVIGIADYNHPYAQDISFRIEERHFSMREYRNQIDNLILYYIDKSEYFPVCNLLIFKNDLSSAVEALLDGINFALHDLDFRMIRHFCRLAAHHNLLDEKITSKISKKLENYITSSNIPPERLNDCMIHIGEIQKILKGGNSQNVIFNLKIRTNVCKRDPIGIEYVNSLCKQLNLALSQNDLGQKGFQVAVSNHSPFEIIIEVIATVASIATIAQTIWYIIDRHQNNNEQKDYVKIDQETYQNYIDNRIELCKKDLLQLKKVYSHKKMNKYINEIMQNLKTDLDALYDNDIMIFKKDNHTDQ